VVGVTEAQKQEQELKESSEIRKIVLELMLPLQSTKRIVNTDNFYTSVQLLESLRVCGLYGRGTIRQNSKHFPKVFKIASSDGLPRGFMRQGVSQETGIVAASWVDSAIVSVISNADSTNITTVYRQVKQEKQPFTAPVCVAEYNAAMQGVDRLDQLRTRFSIADGHSFKKWHKKLALAFLDIARCNAYSTRLLTGIDKDKRDPHRAFMIALTCELMTGAWRQSLGDTGMMYEDPETRKESAQVRSTPSTPRTPTSTTFCSGQKSSQVITGARCRRGCVVCRFEGRHPTESTDYCPNHKVCLCTKKYERAVNLPSYMCPQSDWTCWHKFHQFYLPNKLFNYNGKIRRSSEIFKSYKEQNYSAQAEQVQVEHHEC
jgi:hypothetical protein